MSESENVLQPDGIGSPQPTFDSPGEAAQFYEVELGWRVAHTSRQVWLAARFDLESLMMPEELGRTVLERLYAPGPVIRFPGPPVKWAFLMLPQNMLRDARFTLPADVEHIFGGALLWLPPSNWSDEPLSWVTDPHEDFPSFAVVSAATRHAASARRLAADNETLPR